MKHIFRSRKAVAAMIIILVAGIALGIVGGWAARDYCVHLKKNDFRAHLRKKFTARLQLTAEQQQALESLLDKWVEQYRETRQQHIEDILRNMEQHYVELKALLSPDQLKLLDAMHAEAVDKVRERMR